jgi:hypothetical protein
MIQKTDLEQSKASMLKAARMAIRLKHSLEADKEINEKLPELERRIDDAIQAGVTISLDPSHYLDA